VWIIPSGLKIFSSAKLRGQPSGGSLDHDAEQKVAGVAVGIFISRIEVQCLMRNQVKDFSKHCT
jgi:hypothetical protein